MQQIPEIKAEFLLNTLYPELKEKWVAYFDGTFYRNYNSDVLSIFKDIEEVHVSRDSIVGLLPAGMISNEYSLKGTSEWRAIWEKQKKDIDKLRDAFCPIDTFLFRENLKLEDSASKVIDQNTELVLKEIFDIDVESETNPLKKVFLLMLPFIERLRTDYGFISTLLSELISHRVEVIKRSYSDYDSVISSLPCVIFRVFVDDLNVDSYKALRTQLDELEEFLREWYIPFDTHFEIELVGESTTMMVNYNARMK